jgi:hypothetical protein
MVMGGVRSQSFHKVGLRYSTYSVRPLHQQNQNFGPRPSSTLQHNSGVRGYAGDKLSGRIGSLNFGAGSLYLGDEIVPLILSPA